MSRQRVSSFHLATLALGALVFAAPAPAQNWVSFDAHTRYMALGDSIAMGYGAHPAAQGYVYQLSRNGTIDDSGHLLFCAAGVSGAKSADVLAHQVPQAGLFFANTGVSYRKVITLSVGGNDLMQVLGGADPAAVIGTYAGNLGGVLAGLIASFPDAEIYVANMYDPRLPVSGSADLVAAMNGVTAMVVSAFPNAALVDVFGAFEGRSGLLLSERNGAEAFQVHPTNAGYQVMTAAFADAIGRD